MTGILTKMCCFSILNTSYPPFHCTLCSWEGHRGPVLRASIQEVEHTTSRNIRKGSAYITETIRSVVVWPFENSKVYDKVSVIKHRKSGVNKLKGYSTSAKLLTYHLSAATEVVEALNFCFSKIVTVQCMSLFLRNNRPVCFLFVIANCIYYSISQNLAQSSTHTALACTPSRTKFLCGIIRASSRYLTVR